MDIITWFFVLIFGLAIDCVVRHIFQAYKGYVDCLMISLFGITDCYLQYFRMMAYYLILYSTLIITINTVLILFRLEYTENTLMKSVYYTEEGIYKQSK